MPEQSKQQESALECEIEALADCTQQYIVQGGLFMPDFDPRNEVDWKMLENFCGCPEKPED